MEIGVRIPQAYVDQAEVSSKAKASPMPPYGPKACANNLLSASSLPRSRLNALSVSETKSIKEFTSSQNPQNSQVPGYNLNKEGLGIDQAKVKVVTFWTQLKTIKRATTVSQVFALLPMINKHNMPNFEVVIITPPLTDYFLTCPISVCKSVCEFTFS